MVLKYADLFCALHFYIGLRMLILLHYGQFIFKSPPWLAGLASVSLV